LLRGLSNPIKLTDIALRNEMERISGRGSGNENGKGKVEVFLTEERFGVPPNRKRDREGFQQGKKWITRENGSVQRGRWRGKATRCGSTRFKSPFENTKAKQKTLEPVLSKPPQRGKDWAVGTILYNCWGRRPRWWVQEAKVKVVGARIRTKAGEERVGRACR